MTATPSQEWTEQDERLLQGYAEWPGSYNNRVAREILRLRAENERLAEVFRVDDFREIIDENLSEFLRPDDSEAPMWVYASAICAAASEIASLRSQLAATREGETPNV